MTLSARLSRQSYSFAMLSRLYWLAASFGGLFCVVASSLCAYFTSIDAHPQAVVGLSCAVAAIGFLGRLYDPSESAATSRAIARELDRLRSDFAHGRLSEEQVARRVQKIQRRVPVGSCVFLRG